MQESPEHPRAEAAGSPAPAQVKALGENALLKFVQQPRILLILLGSWNTVAAISEFFVDVHGGKIRGPLGGLAVSWESIPLAVLYFYTARDPKRYQRIFWLALVQLGAAIAAGFYHWGASDVTAGSIVIPVAVSAALGALVFLHLFQPRETEPEAEPR